RLIGYAPALARADLAGSTDVAIRLTPSAVRLEPVSVTATRSSSDPATSPLPTASIDGEQLDRHQQVSLAETIEDLPGLRTLSTGQQVGKPIIRGLEGPRVLTLDNGLRLEDYSWSDE